MLDEWQTVFVCVEVLRPSKLNGVMSSAVSLPNHMHVYKQCRHRSAASDLGLNCLLRPVFANS